MNITNLLSIISIKILSNYNLNFNSFYSEDLEVNVKNIIPKEKIDLIRLEALNPRIKNNNILINFWSEEYQNIDKGNSSTEYYIFLGKTHELCYETFRYYFEILSTGLYKDEAQKKFDEYYFCLKILLNHSNLNYTSEFKKYWHYFLINVKDQIQNQSSNLSNIIASTLNNTLTQSNVNEILRNLTYAINIIENY